MKTLIERWDGQAVVMRFDAETGTWMFIALHNMTLGPASGGTRMKIYPSPEDGLADAMKLAEGMTYKWAAIDFRNGGGKAVLAIPRTLEGEERRGLFLRYGSLVDSLKGVYSTGVDLGTTPEDMVVVRSRTRHVHGVSADKESVDAGAFTALGVFSGLRAALGHVFGSSEVQGRKVLVQGLGDVGGALARYLGDAGAQLLVSDVDPRRIQAITDSFEARVVPLDEVYSAECDVYAPCAVGGTLNRETIPALRSKVVAGSANNQLEVPAEDSKRLLERGILYAPDYVINAGAAMVFGLIARGVVEEGVLARSVEGIGDSLTQIFAEARERGESPVAAARRRVDRILARGPHEDL